MIEPISESQLETQAPIYLHVRGGAHGVQLDCHITPLYCLNCSQQLPSMYWLKSSRYGQLGSVPCACGATIHCVDNDNHIEGIKTYTEIHGSSQELILDYYTIYNLQQAIWPEIQRTIGYDIYQKHGNTITQLADVIQELAAIAGIHIPEQPQYRYAYFERLPVQINRWRYLLEQLKIEMSPENL